MELIEHFAVSGEVRFEKILKLVVVCARLYQMVAGSKSGGVGVNDKNISVERVEEY